MDRVDETLDIRTHERAMRLLDHKHGIEGLTLIRARGRALHCKAIMYVMIGIAALTYASNAHSRELSYLPNKAGGEIVLTDTKSDACPQSTRIAVSRTREGDTLFGCWAASDPYVYIKWADGALSMFKIAEFTAFARKPELGA